MTRFFSKKRQWKMAAIALLTIALMFMSCDDGGSGGSTYLFNGVWENSAGTQISVSGSTGVYKAFGTNISSITQNAIEKGYIKIGDKYWRNISSKGNIIAGNLTWSGQCLRVTYNTSSPDEASGTRWRDCTFTLSANGQTLTCTLDNEVVQTWSKKQ